MIRRFPKLGALLLGCATVLAGCGDKNDSTGPRAVSRQVAAQELTEMSRDTANYSALQAAIALLALENGAEVQSVAITVDGRSASFSMIGLAMAVTDTLDDSLNPDAPGRVYTDTLLVSFGWRGTPGSEVVTAMTSTGNAPFDSLMYPARAMSQVPLGPGSRGAVLRERLTGARLLRPPAAAVRSAANSFVNSLFYYVAGEREYLGFADGPGATVATLTALGGSCDRSLLVQRGADDPFRPLPGTSFTCSNGRITQQYAATLMKYDPNFDDVFTGGPPPVDRAPVALRIASHSLKVPVLTGFLDIFDDGGLGYEALRGDAADRR